MTRPLRIVAVSGGLQRPSRAATLAEHLLDLIGEDIACEPHLIELGELAPQLAGALWRSQLPEAVERQLAAVEQADVLVVATPVYRGSYTGLPAPCRWASMPPTAISPMAACTTRR
ncbi:hypothetical protein G6F64_014488 [Rhizopus arrhizus]|uniref:NADPH-dependent FMN reductase-like domain-containing protein n=1 Tax=Rhizopus oryzae TaxID=64495 RepID=A0A9P6WU13_RHIOR|nr:hypothetical protein G6F64_014488 [Rhizopus arrhizus]